MHTVGVGSVFGVILTLLSWVMIPLGVILVIGGLIRYFWPRDDDPTTILQRRYAQGELSRSEYQALLNDIQSEDR